MKIIYIVEGQTGEYSDFRNWPVKAFVSLEKAIDFLKKVTKEYERLREKYGKGDYWYHNWDYENDENPLDPDMQSDYTGTTYDYYTTELDEEKQ